MIRGGSFIKTLSVKEIDLKICDLYNELGTFDPFVICKSLGIKVIYKKYNPEAFKACCYSVFNDEHLICINDNYDNNSKKLLCAHELGHAVLHKGVGNYFGKNTDIDKEYEANLFAALLTLNSNNYNSMSAYELNNTISNMLNLI